jgi:hypothetical protein
VSYPTAEGPLGKQGVADFWEQARQLIPDLEVETLTWAANGEAVFIEWEARGTLDGKDLRWRGADRFTLRGSLAALEGNYWDTAPIVGAWVK